MKRRIHRKKIGNGFNFSFLHDIDMGFYQVGRLQSKQHCRKQISTKKRKRDCNRKEKENIIFINRDGTILGQDFAERGRPKREIEENRERERDILPKGNSQQDRMPRQDRKRDNIVKSNTPVNFSYSETEEHKNK